MGEIRDRNPKCRSCRYVDRCTGGCRNAALMAGNDYYGIDPDLCWFFEHDGEARIERAAKDAFSAYILRHPPIDQKQSDPEEASHNDCP